MSQEQEQSIHATTAENMEAATAHWRSGPGGMAPPPGASDATSSIGESTPGSVTPRHFDSATKLAQAPEFEAQISAGNPKLQIVSTGAKWENVVGYSRAVKRGPFTFVSGTASVDQATGRVMYPDDPFRQTRQALAIIERALRALGSGLEDVVRTRMFVADLARDSTAISKAHGEMLGAIRPASTMVEVNRMYSQVLVMIEADAVTSHDF